jgi:hypothetical protein
MREVVNKAHVNPRDGLSVARDPKDLLPKSPVYDYALYEQCRERAQPEANPTTAILDGQSVKSAERWRALIRTGRARPLVTFHKRG